MTAFFRFKFEVLSVISIQKIDQARRWLLSKEMNSNFWHQRFTERLLHLFWSQVMHGEDYVSLGFVFGKKSRVAYISDVSRIPIDTERGTCFYLQNCKEVAGCMLSICCKMRSSHLSSSRLETVMSLPQNVADLENSSGLCRDITWWCPSSWYTYTRLSVQGALWSSYGHHLCSTAFCLVIFSSKNMPKFSLCETEWIAQHSLLLGPGISVLLLTACSFGYSRR
jgi:hypothetical protein